MGIDCARLGLKHRSLVLGSERRRNQITPHSTRPRDDWNAADGGGRKRNLCGRDDSADPGKEAKQSATNQKARKIIVYETDKGGGVAGPYSNTTKQKIMPRLPMRESPDLSLDIG